MSPDDEIKSGSWDESLPLERLLDGLWQQREELGLIADELLDIFKRYGLTPPQDETTESPEAANARITSRG